MFDQKYVDDANMEAPASKEIRQNNNEKVKDPHHEHSPLELQWKGCLSLFHSQGSYPQGSLHDVAIVNEDM